MEQRVAAPASEGETSAGDEEDQQEKKRKEEDRQPGEDQPDERPPAPAPELAAAAHGEDDREHGADGADQEDAQREEEGERSVRVLRRDERRVAHALTVGRNYDLRDAFETREGSVSERTSFTTDEARGVGESIGIDWPSAPFDVEQFRMGMDVELEHGLHDLSTNVTDSDPIVTGKIALAHLNEFPDYYTRLERMEEEAKRAHAG